MRIQNLLIDFSNKGIIGDLKNCYNGMVGPAGLTGVDLRDWEERNWIARTYTVILRSRKRAS